MGLRLAAGHRMLNHLAGNSATGAPITHVSAHTAFPATALNEVSGGSYARQAVTFEAVAGTETPGSLDVTNAPVIDIPAGTTVAALGFWTAVTAGTLMADADVTDEVFAAQGTYTVTDTDIALSGLT